MRLERDDQAAVEAFAGRAQRGADLLGVVAVVVDHQDAAFLAPHLEAAIDAAELLEGVRGETPRDAEVVGHRDGGERVERVMTSRHAQPHRAQPLPDPPDLEDRLESLDAQLARLPVGVGRGAVGDEALVHVRQQAAHVHVVHAEHREPVEGHALDELQIRRAHLLHVAEVIEVLRIDVGHDRDDGGEEEERAVALVGLGDQVLSLAESRVRPERAQLAADDDGGIASSLAQDRPEQRGGGGLAVRARDRDAVLHAHQLGEHLGARDHRHLQLARAHHLGIRERDRRGDDQHVDALVDVRRVVHTGEDARAQALQPARALALDDVGAGHRVPEGEQHLRDAAHPDAADPDEMHAPLRSVHCGDSVQRSQRPPGPPNLPSHDAKQLPKRTGIFK